MSFREKVVLKPNRNGGNEFGFKNEKSLEMILLNIANTKLRLNSRVIAYA